MKKILLILILCLGLCSCSRQIFPSDVMAHIITRGEGIPDSYHVYYSDADPDSTNYPDEDIMTALYTQGYHMDSLCEKYAVLVGNDDLPYEIHLLMARSHSNVGDLLEAAEQRKELLAIRKNSNYNEATAERCVQAMTFCTGRYVILLVTDDNHAMRALISSII